MSFHYNLYYLFKEDKEATSMSKERYLEIRKNVQNVYEEIKRKSKEIPP